MAIAQVRGPEAGIKAVETISNRKPLDSYYLLYAVLGEFEARLKHFPIAIEHFQKAIQLTELKSEQTFLANRLRDCEEKVEL